MSSPNSESGDGAFGFAADVHHHQPGALVNRVYGRLNDGAGALIGNALIEGLLEGVEVEGLKAGFEPALKFFGVQLVLPDAFARKSHTGCRRVSEVERKPATAAALAGDPVSQLGPEIVQEGQRVYAAGPSRQREDPQIPARSARRRVKAAAAGPLTVGPASRSLASAGSSTRS